MSQTEESMSFRIETDNGELYVVAGHQIVTADNLEILAIGCAEIVQDGMSTVETIARINELGHCPYYPGPLVSGHSNGQGL